MKTLLTLLIFPTLALGSAAVEPTHQGNDSAMGAQDRDPQRGPLPGTAAEAKPTGAGKESPGDAAQPPFTEADVAPIFTSVQGKRARADFEAGRYEAAA